MIFKCILIFGIVLFIVIAFFLFKKKYSLKIRFLEGKLKFIVNKKETHTALETITNPNWQNYEKVTYFSFDFCFRTQRCCKKC